MSSHCTSGCDPKSLWFVPLEVLHAPGPKLLGLRCGLPVQPPLLNLSLHAGVTERESLLQGPTLQTVWRGSVWAETSFYTSVQSTPCFHIQLVLYHCLSPSQSNSLFSFISLSFSHSLPLCLSLSKIISLSSFKPFSLYLLQSASHRLFHPLCLSLSKSQSLKQHWSFAHFTNLHSMTFFPIYISNFHVISLCHFQNSHNTLRKQLGYGWLFNDRHFYFIYIYIWRLH